MLMEISENENVKHIQNVFLEYIQFKLIVICRGRCNSIHTTPTNKHKISNIYIHIHTFSNFVLKGLNMLYIYSNLENFPST